MGFAEMVRAGTAGCARPETLRARKRICFVAPHAWPVLSRDPRIEVVGGAEVQQAILARLFAANGYRVSMIALDYGQPCVASVDGVTAYKAFAPSAGAPLLRFLHPRMTSMWRALRNADADIYYCRSASIWLWLMTEFCRRRGRRSIYAGASDKDFVPDIGGQVRYARDRWLYRRGLAAVDRIVAQNETQRASCRSVHGREAVVIPSCYQPPEDKDSSRTADRVLWVGMLHENKRPELFLELAARLPHRRFVMIGGPREGSRAFFERIRARAGALPNLELTGFLPLAQVEPWFDRARVLVNTSTYEGMPNTFLQAWARGVPTVATVDVDAPVNKVVANVEELAGGVEKAFSDPSLGARCREYFERQHSPAGVLEHYARLFDEL
ncbi:MAG TPA: glycosyltransferase family 4 protein [Burkholderiales bacterium]|nr:glycosyltransferase family 4 protein [Burkholderiales bacterium]